MTLYSTVLVASGLPPVAGLPPAAPPPVFPRKISDSMDPALHPLLATPLHKEAYPLSKKTAKASRQKLATTVLNLHTKRGRE